MRLYLDYKVTLNKHKIKILLSLDVHTHTLLDLPNAKPILSLYIAANSSVLYFQLRLSLSGRCSECQINEQKIVFECESEID